MNNKIAMLIVTVIAIVGAIGIYYLYGDNDVKETDAKKFHNEYTLVSEDNVFVYKSIDEIINILEGGTGIVYLGFPECPWCQSYVKYLNEVAIENNIKEVYYYNIMMDRNNNTEKYQKIVSLLSDKLLADDNGQKRVFVPDVSFVKNGKILFHDNETSVIDSNISPDEYWNDNNIKVFKAKMTSYISDYTGTCSTCN